MLSIECLLGLLDEREHVAHVENARSHAIRVKGFEFVELLAHRREHDGSTCDGHDRECGATTCVTIELGEDHRVEAHALEEFVGRAHRVLADHRVDHKQGVVRLDGVSDIPQLPHQLRIDGKASCRVHDDDVVEFGHGMRTPCSSDHDRVTHAIAGLRSEHRYSGSLADHHELIHRVGSLKVGSHKQRRSPLLSQVQRQLAGQGCLASTLQACQQDDCRPGLGELKPSALTAQNRDKFLVDDLDHLLSGIERARYLHRQGPLAHGGGELTYDRKRNVSFEQGCPDLADSRIDVGLREPALATQTLEGGGKSI